MSNKLQELTDKLYNEGLSKGKVEGERILAEAKAEADEMIVSARKQAEAIISEAEKAAADLKSKAESDVRMASEHSIQATKKDIENIIVAKAVSPVAEIMSQAGFLKEIIRAVAERFSSGESCDLAMVLPDKLKEELEPWVRNELSESLGHSIEAGFSKKIQGGFTIGPRDGSYFVSMTDGSFRQLIAEYLRPVTRKLLFGE